MFVHKYYEMDPATEDLLFDGTYLQDGMTVLVGDPMLRVDLEEDVNPHLEEKAKIRNRWATISNVTISNDELSFLALYSDGTKRKVIVNVAWPWLVKLNVPIDNTRSFRAFGNGRHDADQTRIFEAPVVPPENTLLLQREEGLTRD